ncbi:galacturonosyltransferase 8-like isoform X2 [Tripterygium wilfordii]|uniref:galacturonosyltransferase 8-like isoform X2 n=1 Tax=Tripterygium wilfordii TaxID=458696 RepID=UPI0018F7F184|nr:galacturonosyltransferase 8-like isoform X2 [Tripterygium wilfordii]
MANPRRPSRRGSFFFFFTFRPLASAITVAVLLFFVLSFLFSTSNSYSSDLHHHGFSSLQYASGFSRRTVLAVQSDPLKPRVEQIRKQA